ncbi:MAG: phytoene desaturase family protein [Solirubrobacteraceae bacterium]
MAEREEQALVIGAGPNGLAAAIRLAEAGVPVAVLEAADRPGGAVRTEELTLPGFRHDTFSSVYPAAAASPVFARMPLAQHGLEWVHPDLCMAHPLEDGVAVGLHRDLAATAASLDRQHRGDGEAWARFVAPYLTAFDAVRATMLSGFPPVRGPLQLVRRAGPRASAQLGLLLAGTAVGLAHRLFEGQGSRAWLYGAAAHADTPMRARGSAIAAFYLNLLGHGAGWPSPRGGAERLIDALAGYLGRLGGTVQTGARVERVLSAGGRVTGVAIADGHHVPAAVVLADVMPGALTAMTGDALASWYRRLLSGFRYGPATVKVDWALDGPIPWSAPDARRAGTVHVGGDETSTIAALEQARGGLAERPFLLLGQQSVADPTRAPAGKHTAWAYTHAPASMAPQLGSKESAQAIERQIERFAPGFRELILARHVLLPSELQARNPNLVYGDVGGGSYTGLQSVFRPAPTLSPYRTPLHGLFLASAAAFPGGAVHGVPGDAAARAALRSLGFAVRAGG